MPHAKIETAASRGEGVFDAMHPVFAEDGKGTDVILLPEDLTRGKGNFRNVDHEGNPEGFKLFQLPRVASRDIFMGSTNKTTQQNTTPIPVHEPGYLVNGPLAFGDDEPDRLLIASLPTPAAPTIKVRPAEVAGYPESTADNPLWLAITGFRDGKHTALSPPVKLPPMDFGQCFKVKIPDNMSLGATHIGWWLSYPGQSTPSQPGQFGLQKITRIGDSFGEESFTGPYNYNVERATGTEIPTPPAPIAMFYPMDRYPCRIGTFSFRITAANDIGESLPSGMSGSRTVAGSSDYNDDQGTPRAGRGRLQIVRGVLPAGSSGWYLYCFVDNQQHRVYNKFTGEGLSKPLPSNLLQVITTGWEGNEEFALSETWLLSSASVPTENTSGIEAPTSPPELPTIFGATRPGPGRYFAKQRDISEDGDYSALSDAGWADVGANEVMEVIFSNPVNQLVNATFVQKGADGYPLGYSVEGEGVTLENGELVIDGSDSPIITTDAISINPNSEWSSGAFLRVLPPLTGVFSGSFEAVLREINAGAVHTDTILASVSSLGDEEYSSTIAPAGYGTPGFQSDTQSAQIIYRFQGSPNMIVRVSRQHLNDYAYGFRRREAGLAGGPANSNPAPETTANPSGAIAVEPSPTPPTSPEVASQVPPDRPALSGEVIETQSFASVPWTQDVAGATLTASSGKLVSSKTGAGAARANIYKTFLPEPGLTERHSIGATLDGITIPTLPANGSITLVELRRPTDGLKYGWIDVDTRREVAKLRIDAPPTSSGNITTTLHEAIPTARTTAVIASREKSTLQITSGPIAAGFISVSVGGVAKDIPVSTGQSGYKEVVQVEITRGASGAGQIAVLLGTPIAWSMPESFATTRVVAGDSPEMVASRLRSWATTANWQNEPWLISGTGRFVKFTSKYASPTRGNHRFLPDLSFESGVDRSHVQANVSVLQQGQDEILIDTIASIAQKLEHTSFDGFSLEATDGAVVIEALEPGSKPDASVDVRSTGVEAVMTLDAGGAQDTIDEVAQKIVATYAGNAYHSVTASGPVITISALSDGAKQDAAFSAGTTGAQAEIQTTVQGSSDMVVHVKDQYGAERQRRIFTGVTNSIIYNLGFSGAGGGYREEGNSQAVMQVWGSTGSGTTKTLRGLFEDVDLGGYPAGMIAVGVTAESSPSLTWEVRIDELEITDRGQTYYDYHDYEGNLVNQIHSSHPPNLAPSEGFGIRSRSYAVLPETEYSASIFARWAGFREFCEPLFLYLVTPNDEIRPLGNLTDPAVIDPAIPSGITGTKVWHETEPFTFTTPADCYEFRLESKTISGGELVIQKFAFSKGTEVKRTNLYATEGFYISTLNIGTPNIRPSSLWGRKRKELRGDVEVVDGTSASALYRVRDPGGVYGNSVSNPSLLEEKDEIRIDISASGNGTKTPVVRSGSPSAEYVLRSAGGPLPTLLKSDRTEFDGGAFFVNLNRYAEPPEAIITTLPGRRFVRFATYPPVGNQPGYELQVFDSETKKYLEDRIGLVDVVIESWDKILTVRHGPGSERIVFESQSLQEKINGRWCGWWVAKFPEAQIIDMRDLPL